MRRQATKLSDQDLTAIKHDWDSLCEAAARRPFSEILDGERGDEVRAVVRAILSSPLPPLTEDGGTPGHLLAMLGNPRFDGILPELVCAVLADMFVSGEVIKDPEGDLRLGRRTDRRRTRSGDRIRIARLSWGEARGRLRHLATQAADVHGGRVANRLAAYAMLLEEHAEQGAEIRAELEELAVRTPAGPLGEVLREACQIVRDVLGP
jgi:hypothetical protein